MKTATKTKVPADLPAEAARWWLSMFDTFDFTVDPGGTELLTAAAWQLARMLDARTCLADTGLLVKDRFGQLRENPAAVSERAAANQFRLLCRELGVSDGSDEAARLTRNPRGR